MRSLSRRHKAKNQHKRHERHERSSQHVQHNRPALGIPITRKMTIAEMLLSPKFSIALLVFGAFMAVMPEIVHANPLMDNQITQGILSFATDVGPWLAGVSIAVGVANCGYCLFRRANCDETDTKRWNDKIKTTIICSGAAAVVTGALPPVLNHYFGVS